MRLSCCLPLKAHCGYSRVSESEGTEETECHTTPLSDKKKKKKDVTNAFLALPGLTSLSEVKGKARE